MYLNCHSHFSLNYGVLSPRVLVRAAADSGIKALALTDINNVSGSFEFYRACEEAGIKPILGIEFRDADQHLMYIGLAKNEAGFAALNRLLSEGSLPGKSLPEIPPSMQDVYIIYPGAVKPIEHFREYEYVGIRPENINALFSSPLRHHPGKLVALCPVTFLNEEGYEVHLVLRAIGKNEIITKLTPHDQAHHTERLLPVKQQLKQFELYPQIIQNTARIVRNCSIKFEKSLEHNRRTFTGSREDDRELLHKLAMEGCERRYGKRNRTARKRVEKELALVNKLGFTSYFLITWDVVKYARGSDIFHVGRGSGANSIVAYCIGITDVDPLELNLYFERFINEHRTSPPDFDVDFPSNQRHLILDYLFKRYGRHHTAFVATYDTFKYRSIVREVGKAYGLPKEELDRIIANPQRPEDHHELAGKIWKCAHHLEGIPNELSVHASGVIISENPLYNFSALRVMPFGFPIVHFDMYTAEDWGFNKFDILGQCGLSHIRDTIQYVHENQGKSVDVFNHEVVFKDEKCRNLLKSGDTIGIFYAESPNMRDLLPKMGCDNYPDLVVASSIIRPGVSSSGMMKEYLSRYHAPHSFEYLHPVFREHLAETFGVMVFQEDVMKVVHHFAGLDLAECDVLRKIMSGKRRHSETFHMYQNKYFKNCEERGYTKQLAEEVWRQVESFSGYSFCKAHSAAFAVLSFEDLYLKSYYPLEFLTAVVNNFGGFYRMEVYLHEAKRHGATIHAPCVNRSDGLAHIRDKDIYLGLKFIQGIQRELIDEIIYQREVFGPYKSFEDFLRRLDIPGTQLELLIRANALRFTGLNKYELMREKGRLLQPKTEHATTGVLFEDPAENFEMPDVEVGPFDQAFDELELLKFPLCSPFDLVNWNYLAEKGFPIPEPYRQDYPSHKLPTEKTDTQGNTKRLKKSKKLITVEEMPGATNKMVHILAYFICRKTTATKHGDRMAFDAWWDINGDYLNTVIFPRPMKQFPYRGVGVYLLYGKVIEEFSVYNLDVHYMEKIPYVPDTRFAP
jgi:DNA-directed DNA polymerase III PolC